MVQNLTFVESVLTKGLFKRNTNLKNLGKFVPYGKFTKYVVSHDKNRTVSNFVVRHEILSEFVSWFRTPQCAAYQKVLFRVNTSLPNYVGSFSY
jgi:hypothetical protein